MEHVIPIKAVQPPRPPTATDVHIASLVLLVQPDARPSLEHYIDSLRECTHYSGERESALVVVMEVDNESGINRIIDNLHQQAGVLSVNLVYHHCDSAQSMTEEMTT